MKIGIPRALLYHKYGILWESFFEYLGIDTITSPPSNKEILEKGILLSPDEACLSLKIYLGHIKYLSNKCDYILIPRIESLKKNEKTCTNMLALYDIVNNTFNVGILDYNIDVNHNYDELYAFVTIAKQLNIKRIDAIKAYKYAKEEVRQIEEGKAIKQESLIKTQKLKILLAGHSYNLHDELIGKSVSKHLQNNDINVLYSDINNEKINNIYSKSNIISKEIYWTYNKEIFSSISYYLDKVDGIILLSTFPCGPDSLCNEITIRKIKNKPIITVIVDELNNDSGLLTRLESFIEILKEKKELDKIE